MADFNLQPVATQIKPVQGMSLGDMINIARGAQAYQQERQINPLELQAKQMAVQQAQQVNPLIARQAQAQAQTAETGAESTAMDLRTKQLTGITNRLSSVINNPMVVQAEQNPESADPAKLAQIMSDYGMEQAMSLGIPKDKAQNLIAPYVEAAKDPKTLRTFLKEKMLSTLDQGSRLSAMQPSGPMIGTGAGGYQVQTGEFGGVPRGTIVPGTAYEQQVPPTQEVVNPLGQRQLVGPLSQRGQGPVVTGLGPAGVAAATVPAEQFAKDWPVTQASAAEAPGRLAIFQNIKKLTPDAFTGPTADRRQAVASFAQVLGIPVYELEAATTDELMKNTKLLQLAGGNTDAARSLAEFANPNTKMTKEGINRVVDQLMGIEKMKVARANFLGQFTGDPGKYAQAMDNFRQISDPRIFQEMTKEDVEKLRKSMSPRERQEMSERIRMARQLGVIQ